MAQLGGSSQRREPWLGVRTPDSISELPGPLAGFLPIPSLFRFLAVCLGMGRSRAVNTPRSKVRPTEHFLGALNFLNKLPVFTCWELQGEIPDPRILKKTKSDHTQPLRPRKQQNQQLLYKWNLTFHQPGISNCFQARSLPKV